MGVEYQADHIAMYHPVTGGKVRVNTSRQARILARSGWLEGTYPEPVVGSSLHDGPTKKPRKRKSKKQKEGS